MATREPLTSHRVPDEAQLRAAAESAELSFGDALVLLAYKGFTTITNSGSEIVNPEKNIGRSIIISLSVCVVVYLLVGFAVAGT